MPNIADVLEKVEAAAGRLNADGDVIKAAYRALVEASIAHELQEFDRLKPRA